MMGSHQIYLLTFVVTDDTSEPDHDRRVEFDLPLDTWPAPWPSPFVRIAFADTPNGRHVTVSRFSGDPYPSATSWAATGWRLSRMRARRTATRPDLLRHHVLLAD